MKRNEGKDEILIFEFGEGGEGMNGKWKREKRKGKKRKLRGEGESERERTASFLEMYGQLGVPFGKLQLDCHSESLRLRDNLLKLDQMKIRVFPVVSS